MDIVKTYSRRSLFWIIFFTGFLCILIVLGFLFGLRTASAKIVWLAQADLSEIREFIHHVAVMMDTAGTYFAPVSAGVLSVFGLLLWLFLHVSFKRVIKKSELLIRKQSGKDKIKAVSEEKEKRLNDRRLFLHILSVFQREGRLMDFFAEELDEYEDDQIGGAVRSIHENCKKVIGKYLTTEPVIKEEEGEEITISPEFDPAAIKLTGNVTGEPPFNGVVRHRGWKAKKLDMPTLAGVQNPDIIAPAEVEIL